jgi:predicted transcriptional regulator
MANKEPLRSMPVYLTDAVRKRLRIAAAKNDTTMTAIAAEAIEKALEDLEKEGK